MTETNFFIGFKGRFFKEVTITPIFEFVVKESVFKDYINKLVFNDIAHDNYKFAMAFSDNTIKIFSSKDNTLWYNLLGGSMTIIPKSFVAHPSLIGFSSVHLTKYSVIGSLGNLIRIYNFNSKN